jgi:hypothetical protein
MSAFNVSRETINCVVSAFDQARREHWGRQQPAEDLDALGLALALMNAEAVAQRYAEPAEQVEPFRYCEVDYPLAQRYKSVGCLRYQCSEGNVPESPLYGRLTELYDRLAHELAHTIAAVDAARWDLEDVRRQARYRVG